jgi:hypothetical protein
LFLDLIRISNVDGLNGFLEIFRNLEDEALKFLFCRKGSLPLRESELTPVQHFQRDEISNLLVAVNKPSHFIGELKPFATFIICHNFLSKSQLGVANSSSTIAAFVVDGQAAEDAAHR